MQNSKGSIYLFSKMNLGYFAIITGQFHVGKIIEKLIHQRLNQFLEDNECFYPH